MTDLLPRDIKGYINETLRPALEGLDASHRRARKKVMVGAAGVTTAALLGLMWYMARVQGPMGWVDWAVAIGVVVGAAVVSQLLFYGWVVRGKDRELSQEVLAPLLEHIHGPVGELEGRRRWQEEVKEALCQWPVDRFVSRQGFRVGGGGEEKRLAEVAATMRVRVDEGERKEKSCHQIHGWVMEGRLSEGEGWEDVVVAITPRPGAEEWREVETLGGEALEVRAAGVLAVVPWVAERASEPMRPLRLPHVEFDDRCEVWTNDVAAARGLMGDAMIEAISRAAALWGRAEGQGYFEVVIKGGRIYVWWPRVTTVSQVRFLELADQVEWLVEWARDIGAGARILDAA